MSRLNQGEQIRALDLIDHFNDNPHLSDALEALLDTKHGSVILRVLVAAEKAEAADLAARATRYDPPLTASEVELEASALRHPAATADLFLAAALDEGDA